MNAEISLVTGELDLGPERQVERLQQQFVKRVGEFHQLAGKAFGYYGSRLRAGHNYNSEAMVKLAERVEDFEELVGMIPKGHFLQLGLTPIEFFRFHGNQSLQNFTHIEQTPTGPQYWLTINHDPPDRNNNPPNQKLLTLTPIGFKGTQPKAQFNFLLWAGNTVSEVGEAIYPENILATRIVSDSPEP